MTEAIVIETKILSTHESLITIYDHDLNQDYQWTLSADKSINKYVANKIVGNKTISLIGNLDTIRIELSTADSIDIIVVSTTQDTFYARVLSGMRPIENKPPQSDTIPFTLNEANNIIINAKLNQIDSLQLMLHTAAGEVNIIESASTNLTSLNNFQSETGAKSWGGNNDFRYAENNELSIGPFTWNDITIYEDRFSGPGSDGKFGLNLFEDKVVEIDFDNKNLIIHTTLPDYIDHYQKLDILFDRGMMFIPLTLTIEGQDIKHKFLIHSGYAGAALIDDEFATQHLLNEKLKTISEQDLKDSFGNIIKTKKAILPQLNIEKFQLNEIPVSFFSGSIGRQKISMMGGDLIKRFNIIIDMRQAQLYLKPNNLYSSAYWE